jgi:hypothetical protein
LPSRSGSAAAYALSAGKKSAAAASRSFCASVAPHWRLVSVLYRSLMLGHGARRRTVRLLDREERSPAPSLGDRFLLCQHQRQRRSSAMWTASGACRRTAGDNAELRSLCRISIARYCASYGAASGLGSCPVRARARVRRSYKAPVTSDRDAPRPPRRRGAAPRGSRRAMASRLDRGMRASLELFVQVISRAFLGYNITSYPSVTALLPFIT